MNFDVRLTAGAERDLATLYDGTVVNRSPVEAETLLHSILERTAALADFPLRGAIPPELERLGPTEFRQIGLPPYRIVYRVMGATVFIMVIADGRRDMQALLERRLLG